MPQAAVLKIDGAVSATDKEKTMKPNTKEKQPPSGAITLTNVKFGLGLLAATPGALEVLAEGEMQKLLQRHASGDWGLCCEEDREANEYALYEGLRLLSVFKTKSKQKIWIITEADRSSTTLLLPAEY